MSDELKQLLPPDYKAIVLEVSKHGDATVGQMVGRGMQFSHGKADPAILKLLFTMLENASHEIGYTRHSTAQTLLGDD